MKWLTLLLVLYSSISLPQTIKFAINSPENILKFADHLYCEQDFLRAIIEYDRILQRTSEDSIVFKTALAYLNMGDYNNSIKRFGEIESSSKLFEESQLQKLKLYFLLENFVSLREVYKIEFEDTRHQFYSNALKLNNFSYLVTEDLLPEKNDFLSPFSKSEKIEIEKYYDWKSDPPNKSSALAGIMSAVVPGSGKMYAGEWGDGITALVVTGLFAFLAYDNFRADHNTRAWIFTGLGAFFYAGNIYGSVAAAQIYNARIAFEFEDGLNLYLQEQNYFTPEYNYCDKN